MDFFSTVPTSVLTLPLFGTLLSLLGLPICFYLGYRYRNSRRFIIVVRSVLALMMLLVYLWYVRIGFPLNEALPLYHCRIGMFTILLLPNRNIFKHYFALLGVVGAVLAVAVPDFYLYPLVHVTNTFFFVGHYSLLILSLAYLFEKAEQELSWRQIISITLGLNLALVIVNYLTLANYGFLADTPLIHTTNIPFNYVLVSAVMILLVKLVSVMLQFFSAKNNCFMKTF